MQNVDALNEKLLHKLIYKNARAEHQSCNYFFIQKCSSAARLKFDTITKTIYRKIELFKSTFQDYKS